MASTTTPSSSASPARRCSLDDSDRAERMRAWESLRRDALIDERVDGDVTVVVLAAKAGVRARLEALIEAERSWCSFLRFGVSEDDEQIAVEIRAAGSDD